MTKKSLQNWYNSGDFSSSEKETIKKFGVGDYYPERERKDFRKIYYWDEILDRNKWKINIPGRIEKMIFFSADWNNNLLIVVNAGNDVNLIVYEMPTQKAGNPAGGDLKKFSVGSYSNSEGALNEARELERKLKYRDNPILAYNYGLVSIFFYKDENYNSSLYPMDFGKDDVVKRTELPYDARSNPDKYIKPLDIVLAVNRDMVHSCVYLGDKKVCHVIAISKKGVVRIDSWNYFLDDVLSNTDKILCYHPVIAFKKPDTIIRHIAKSVEGTSNYFRPGVKNSKSGEFNISTNSKGESNNCENFTNVCVLGINFSELDTRKSGGEAILFNGDSCISETTKKLDELTTYTPYSKINDIKRYVNQGNTNRVDTYVDREGIEMDERIEVQPKNWYRLNNTVDAVDILTFGLGRLFL